MFNYFGYGIPFSYIRDAFKKKKGSEGDIGPFSFFLPILNGTRGIGTQKIVYWPPPPPSGNRDKLNFSRG